MSRLVACVITDQKLTEIRALSQSFWHRNCSLGVTRSGGCAPFESRFLFAFINADDRSMSGPTLGLRPSPSAAGSNLAQCFAFQVKSLSGPPILPCLPSARATSFVCLTPLSWQRAEERCQDRSSSPQIGWSQSLAERPPLSSRRIQ
jgi:hypothetical protein